MRTEAEQAAVEVESMFAVVIAAERGRGIAKLIRAQAAEIFRLSECLRAFNVEPNDMTPERAKEINAEWQKAMDLVK